MIDNFFILQAFVPMYLVMYLVLKWHRNNGGLNLIAPGAEAAMNCDGSQDPCIYCGHKIPVGSAACLNCGKCW